MWPWEHALLGYLVYSLLRRGYDRRAPGGPETVAVVVASMLPDLVDKPLAWQFGAFRSGYALAHSIFLAVPLAIAAGLVARRYERAPVGVAFGVGYLLHLVGDVIPVYLSRGEWTVRHLLWPAVVTEGTPRDGFVDGVATNLEPYVESLLAPEPTPALLLQAAILTGAVALWTVDGRPGWRLVRRALGRPFAGPDRDTRPSE